MPIKKQKTFLSRFKKYFFIALVSVTALIILLIFIVWFLWPVKNPQLQRATVNDLSFSQAKTAVVSINIEEEKSGVKPECRSKLFLHSQPTKKAVTMYHGITACTSQFSQLAQYFYNQGYNVYVPRAPHHGTERNLDHARITSQELIDYINRSSDITKALGENVGVIGTSGGGNLATWAAHYRPEIKRILTLAPFYEPSVSQSPKWQIRPLLVLHGNNLIPDQLNKPDDPQTALSYRALAKYVTVFNNLQTPPKNKGLEKVSLVMAEDDYWIDQPLAISTLESLASANQRLLTRFQIDASYKLEHDIVGPENKAVITHMDYTYPNYFNLYDN